MNKKWNQYLSKREQQIMDSVYRRGRATVAEIMGDLPDAPSNAAVRTHLRILEAKGHLGHIEEAGKFIYRPIRQRHVAARSALAGLLRTYFDDSVEKVMATLLSVKSADLDAEELERLTALINNARNTTPLVDARVSPADGRGDGSSKEEAAEGGGD